jgi:hypothetical protein
MTTESIEWFEIPKERPPAKKRLLLIASAAGDPPDIQLMSRSEIVVGYWSGSQFHPMTLDHNDLGAKLRVTHWAAVDRCLPHRIELRHQRILDEDVCE